MAKSGHKSGLAASIAKAYTRKWSFLAAFVMVFFFSFSILSSMGIVPEAAKEDTKLTAARQTASALDALPKELPLLIEIPSLDMEVSVKNPVSTDAKTLDAALLTGAVRYPTSAKLGEEGNVILFGHSSYLPVVRNSAYKAFNEIQDLKAGDRITVSGNGQAYVYAVEEVYKADAGEDAIPLTVSGRMLTLVTCDSFASKSDRFVVTAKLVESYPLTN